MRRRDWRARIGVVSQGAEVIADGNIHVYGPLRGKAMAGARGDTATQMAETLGVSQMDDTVHATFGALVEDLLTRGNIKPDPERGGEVNGLRIANDTPLAISTIAKFAAHCARPLTATAAHRTSLIAHPRSLIADRGRA